MEIDHHIWPIRGYQRVDTLQRMDGRQLHPGGLVQDLQDVRCKLESHGDHSHFPSLGSEQRYFHRPVLNPS